MIDFADAVIQYFVDLRGKGLTVSGIDQQTLLDWERRDVPLHIALEGIDTAFARKKDPPKSLRECQRWVNAAAKKAADAQGVATATANGVALPDWPTVGETVEAPAAPPTPSISEREAERTNAWLEAAKGSAQPHVASAAAALTAEVATRRAAGADELELSQVLDDALAVYALRELPAQDAAVVRVAMAKAANTARERGATDRAAEAQRRRALRDAIGAPAR